MSTKNKYRIWPAYVITHGNPVTSDKEHVVYYRVQIKGIWGWCDMCGAEPKEAAAVFMNALIEAEKEGAA